MKTAEKQYIPAVDGAGAVTDPLETGGVALPVWVRDWGDPTAVPVDVEQAKAVVAVAVKQT